MDPLIFRAELIAGLCAGAACFGVLYLVSRLLDRPTRVRGEARKDLMRLRKELDEGR